MSKYLNLLVAVFALGAVLATLFLYTEINNVSELKAAKMGYPFYFLQQDFSARYDGHPFFPTWERDDFREKVSPAVGFNVWGFVADFLIFFGIIRSGIYFLEKLENLYKKDKSGRYTRGDK